jgi:3'-5' exoribonuclease
MLSGDQADNPVGEGVTPVAAKSSRKYVGELTPGDVFDGVLLVNEASLATTKTGKYYVRATLADRTGSLKANMWDADEGSLKDFPENGYVRVRGRAESYRGQVQLKIEKVRPAKDSEVDVADFLVTSPEDVGQMQSELKRLASAVKDPSLSALLKSFFTEDEEFLERFSRAPGASSYHHAYVGGLLEHTLWVAKEADAVAKQNERLWRDLLLAAALLHDIGKMDELSSDPGFNYTDEGYLIGHVVLGALEVEKRIRRIDGFPAELRLEMLHMVLSHHGQKEFGSPVMPATPEAIALHHVDNLDAKVQAADAAMKAPAAEGARWSEYNKMLSARMFRRPERRT